MSDHWSRISEAGATRGMRIMVWIHRHLGRAGFSIALVPVMIYYQLRRRTARQASGDYIRRVRREHPQALPPGPVWWLTFRHFLEFGHSLLQKFLAWTAEPPVVSMHQHEEEELFSTVDRGVGLLLIGSHFGNLEFSRGISRRHPDLIINVLLHDKHAGKFAELMASAEPMSRMHLIQVTEIDLPLTLQLREKVARGEWVVIAGDRVPVTGDAHTVTATFLGDAAEFPIGPYVLGSVLQCPVYLLHCFRLGPIHHLGFEHFSDRLEIPRRERQEKIRLLAQEFAIALERQVVRSPLQWFNFYDFWRDRRETASGAASENEKD